MHRPHVGAIRWSTLRIGSRLRDLPRAHSGGVVPIDPEFYYHVAVLAYMCLLAIYGRRTALAHEESLEILKRWERSR